MNRALQIMLSFIAPAIIQTPSVNFIGAIVDPGSVIPLFQANTLNSMSAAGELNFLANATTAGTITALGNASFQWTNGAATTVTIDSAYNICKTLPQPLSVGQTFVFEMTTNAATTIATPTLSDTAVTLAGTTSMLASALRRYRGNITQVTTTVGMPTTAGTTFTSIAQVGTTNNYTVTLGTNALVPVVGTLIFLNVTTGTLPSGWYPINKVTSATSFVIAAPTSAAAWTATVATVGTGIVAPATYSPTLTITGLYTIGASVAV